MADLIDSEDLVNLAGNNGNGFLYQIPSASVKVLIRLLNASWEQGILAKDEYASKIATAKADLEALLSGESAHISAGAVTVPTIDAPGATQTAADVLGVFDTKYDELVTFLSDRFAAFRTDYFPDDDTAYQAAEDWLTAALANPAAGLPPTVAAQIWGDDQARILDDATRAADSVLAQFAARRFPLPPGAAASAVMQIQQKAQDAMAESSRKVALLSVELQKFNVEKITAMRNAAMASAIQYISALTAGQNLAAQVVGTGYDAESRVISAATGLYSARTQAAETVSKIAQYNNSAALEAAAKNQMADLALIENKMKALLAEAQSIAQMATSLFNNLHASVGMTAGGTTISSSSS